jgi:Ca2+-binding EF-hand superfamily protein
MSDENHILNEEELEIMEAFKIFDKNGDKKISSKP